MLNQSEKMKKIDRIALNIIALCYVLALVGDWYLEDRLADAVASGIMISTIDEDG